MIVADSSIKTFRRAVVFAEESDEGRRLDVYLAERFTYHSRTEWQNLVGKGKIMVNGKSSRSSRRMVEGDRVEYDTGDITEPEVDPSFQEVFSDEYIIVVSKSGNLPCHPAGIFFRNTLWRLLSEKFGKIYFVNRIDRETSGLVLVARSPAVAAAMSETHSGIVKKYIAVVHGKFPDACNAVGFLTDGICSAVRKKRKFYQGDQLGKKDEYSETRFRFLGANGDLSIVEAELATGRLHQIRATLCSLGFPLVGDKIYGPDETIYLRFIEDAMTDDDRRILMIGRQALHSSWLEFQHPISGENLVFRAELPGDMKKLLGATL
jgi:RluA family pseudouridine synthase